MSNYVDEKDLRKAINKMLDKYRFERKGKLMTAKVKIHLKLNDYLYDFILQDGCHWGFSTGNGVRESNLQDYLDRVLEPRMLEYANAKNIRVIPTHKTWELGDTLYG